MAENRSSQRGRRSLALVATSVLIAFAILAIVQFLISGGEHCIKDVRIVANLQYLVQGDTAPADLPNSEAVARTLEMPLGDDALRDEFIELGVALAVNPGWNRQVEMAAPALVAYRPEEPCRHWVDGQGVVTANMNPVPPNWPVILEPDN